LFFIDIEVRYPNTEFISFGAFFIKYLPKPIIVNGRSKSIINIKIQNPIVNLLYYSSRFYFVIITNFLHNYILYAFLFFSFYHKLTINHHFF